MPLSLAGTKHDWRECDDEHCDAFPCRVYKEGWADGYETGRAVGYGEGYAAGYGEGEAQGFTAGYAAGAASGD